MFVRSAENKMVTLFPSPVNIDRLDVDSFFLSL